MVTTADAVTRRRNFSPWHQWMTRLAETQSVDPLPVDALATLESWQARCRGRLVELLGPWPEPVPLNLETLDEEHCDGYRQARVVFDSEAGMSVPAYLLVPDDRTEPGPAILACHGHGPGKALVVGLETTEAPHGDYARQLARRGYVVLAPDLRCFGERADWNPPDIYACDINLVHATMAGLSPLTQNLFDLTRCLDVLEGHELVDPARLGMVGLSLGGTMTLFTAAWDERVAAAVVSGFFSSWTESHKMPWNMCGSQVLPGMLGRLEHVDLGALIAPRPLLVQTGTEDLIFPVAAARKSVSQLGAVYRHLGAEGRLVHDVFEGDHQWREAGPAAFLDRWLGRTRAA
ncbi:MAG TPA: alpha/beta hydrolase family protein [Acidimicrobiia bacterium]|jgi:dienelactone hydrolase|nr:alpha/beta hydrolase family protein [Acidimicrobiia bacterium]